MRGRTGAERLRSTARRMLLIPHPPWVPKGAQAPLEKPRRRTLIVGLGYPKRRVARGPRTGRANRLEVPALPPLQQEEQSREAEPEEQEERAAEEPYRVVDPPHKHAEQRVACPEQLHFLSHKVLLLRLSLARQDGGPQVAGGRHGRSLGPLHCRAAEAGDPPSLHSSPGRQPHPPGRPPLRACSSPAPPALGPGRSLRPLRALRRLSCSCARLAPPPDSRPPRLGAQPAAGPGGRWLPR